VMNQLGIVVGILFSQVLGLYYSTETEWRTILMAGAGLAVAQVVLLPFCQESPRFLALQPGGAAKAKRSLQILRGRQDLSQQLSGINGVIFYSTAIMSQILPSSGAMITVYISIVNVIMTVIAAYLMDKAGRRTLLMTSAVAMGVSSFLLAWSLNYEIPMLSAFSIIAFVATFAIGLGPIPFLIIPEVVDTAAVASASAYALSVNWTTNFIVSVMFLKLQEWWGGNVFYLFCVILGLLTFAINRIIPETRGKTVEEVAKSWQPPHRH
ncbi:Solute carrier 2, facilitated glucose transporter member 2, partial [Mortierella sp. GBA35]